MRVVLDVNVLVSAVLTPGGEGDAIRSQVEDRFVLLVSDFLLDELNRVLHYPRIRSAFGHLTDAGVAEYVAGLRTRGEVITVTSTLDVCSDPDDNPILAIAVDGRADHLVTRNTSHFPTTYQNIEILTPAEFRAVLQTRPENTPPDSENPTPQ